MRTNIDRFDYYLPEPIGGQMKYWLLSYDKKFLFKESRLKADGSPIYNDVSECMAMEVGRLIGLEMAEYYLCHINGHNGVLTPDFLNNEASKSIPNKEEFFDGVWLIDQVDPGFKNTSLINPTTHQYYTVDLLLASIEKYGVQKQALEMLIFDALIGNRDRNPSNYGIIHNLESDTFRFSPIYDSGASLGVSMVDHRLAACYDKKGVVVNQKQLELVIHHHIVGKVTLERHFQYREKRAWDLEEEKRILTKLEAKKRELTPLLESGQITPIDYHKTLNNIGQEFRKYDITTLEYRPLISYLTLFYPDEIEDIMNQIAKNINADTINHLFDYYKDELPPDRLAMAKQIVIERASWMTEYYENNKMKGWGKIK